MATVLVTRPAEVAERTAATLRRRGHRVLLAPVLTIERIEAAPPPVSDVQALLVTSRQAVPGVAGWADRPAVWAVGEGTAAALAEAGVAVVGVGEGDGESLGRLLVARLDPHDGALLHASGAVVAAGLKRTVEAAGFTYRVYPVYRAVPAAALPAAAVAALSAGHVDAVTLHSPETAKHFLVLLAAAELTAATPRLAALCLSENVAAAVRAARWRRVAVAPRPDETGMGALLEAAAL